LIVIVIVGPHALTITMTINYPLSALSTLNSLLSTLQLEAPA
jgi:hypothetical protein